MTYTPAANYNGADSFTFKANDGTRRLERRDRVDHGHRGQRRAGRANDARPSTTDEDTPKAITLTATDVDGATLTYAIVDAPAHGTLSGTAPALTYTPAANYNGPDSFTFKANDGTADSNVATVSITVTAVNDAPVASDETRHDRRGHGEGDHAERDRRRRSTLTYTIVTRADARHAERHRAGA